MALVAAPFEARILLGTKNDKTRAIPLKANPATVTTYALMVTAVTDFLVSLALVSAGVVKSYSITGRAVEDAYNRPTSDEAEGRDTAVVVVGIEDQPLKRGSIFIPMPKIGIFRGTAGAIMDEIDIADADLITYVTHFRTGGDFTISDGELADVLIYSGERTK